MTSFDILFEIERGTSNPVPPAWCATLSGNPNSTRIRFLRGVRGDLLELARHPKSTCLWIGIGCQRGVSKLTIQRAIESVFTEYNLDLATVMGIATVDRKANEPGLLEYCRESGWFLKIYSPERLNSVAVTHPSQLVSTLVGTASVAEAAALCAARTDILLVSKQICKIDPEDGFVTLAISAS